MSKFARGFYLPKSYDSWPFPFTEVSTKEELDPDRKLYFVPPITASTPRRVDASVLEKSKHHNKPASMDTLKREYSEYILKYQEEVQRFHDLERQRLSLQDEIDKLQEEISVLSKENKVVDEEFHKLGLSKSPQPNNN